MLTQSRRRVLVKYFRGNSIILCATNIYNQPLMYLLIQRWKFVSRSELTRILNAYDKIQVKLKLYAPRCN